MDLLGDLGTSDQLTSVRAENAVLQEKVKHLSFRVKELTIENESLKAEVEIYREKERATNGGSVTNDSNATTTPSSNGSNNNNEVVVDCDDFVRSGNGQYPKIADITLQNLHGNANPLCCSLSGDDTILATGGADCFLSLCAWGGAATTNDEASAAKVVQQACRIRCDGPVISTAFAPPHPTTKSKLVAAGCMDGNVWIVCYDLQTGNKGLITKATTKIPTKHGKYVKTVAWSSTNNNTSILATASADGTVQIHEISVKVDYSKEEDDNDADGQTTIELKTVETLHLQGAVESIVFLKKQQDDNTTTTTSEELCCYARGKPYLICFDITQDYQQRKINLNYGGKPPPSGQTLEDQHVSFAVMDMVTSPNHKYLALATDTSRNIIVEVATGFHIRNLYGHQNDGYSNPKVAWSWNGQYLLGNTQDDAGCLCVWDIASSQLTARHNVEHGQTIRDMFSSKSMDTLVTTSFDKQTKLWFAS